MLALGKTGEREYSWDRDIYIDNHYRPTNATWARDLYTFSGCLMGKLKKSDKVSNIAQIANALAVATVFISLWTQISR